MVDILSFVRQLIQEDDSITDQGNCRNSAIKLKSALKKKFPDEKVDYIAYPEARAGNGVHYAIETDDDIINAVPAPGIPQYIGPKSSAFPTFSLFKKVDKVK